MIHSITQLNLNPEKDNPFLGNLSITGDFYRAMIKTFGKPDRISNELAEKSQALRRYLAAKRPDIDLTSWIHSWQAMSTMEEQKRVAMLLGF